MFPDDVTPHFVRVEGDYALVMVDTRLYSAEALRSTAHRFTGRCAVHLQHETEHVIAVRFHVTQLNASGTEVAESFLNELLDQTLREQVGRETEGVRNLLLAHALSETALINADLETVDPMTDPLGIAVPDR